MVVVVDAGGTTVLSVPRASKAGDRSATGVVAGGALVVVVVDDDDEGRAPDRTPRARVS